jgi:hypothetical protein
MAWLLSGVFDGIETVATTLKAVGAATKAASGLARNNVAKIFLGAGDNDVTDALRTCTKAISDMTDESVKVNAAVSTATFAWKCGPPVAKALLTAGAGRLLAIVIAGVTGIVSLALDLGNFLSSTIRELFDGVPDYVIRIVASGVAARTDAIPNGAGPSWPACSPSELFAVAVAAEHFDPHDPSYKTMGPNQRATVYGTQCYKNWAFGAVSLPNTGTTDAGTIFEYVGGKWKESSIYWCDAANQGLPADVVDHFGIAHPPQYCAPS